MSKVAEPPFDTRLVAGRESAAARRVPEDRVVGVRGHHGPAVYWSADPFFAGLAALRSAGDTPGFEATLGSSSSPIR